MTYCRITYLILHMCISCLSIELCNLERHAFITAL